MLGQTTQQLIMRFPGTDPNAIGSWRLMGVPPPTPAAAPYAGPSASYPAVLLDGTPSTTACAPPPLPSPPPSPPSPPPPLFCSDPVCTEHGSAEAANASCLARWEHC